MQIPGEIRRSGVRGAVKALSSNPNPPFCVIKVFIVGESQGQWQILDLYCQSLSEKKENINFG